MDDLMIRMLQLSHQGYACSQVMILLALEACGRSNPDLVRCMAGPAYGCGDGRGTCGTLTAGCCLLALYAGPGDGGQTVAERLVLMQQDLMDWFAGRVGAPDGAITCAAVVGTEGPAAARQRCGALVADTYRRVMAILEAQGYDPAVMG
jgi:hypothetical protein